MIISNLQVLLAERNLRITRVSNDTGISRTTLTAMTQNTFKGIQRDTMDKLSIYLNVDPGKLFDFAPITVSYNFDVSESEDVDPHGEAVREIEAFINIDDGVNKSVIELKGLLDYIFGATPHMADVELHPANETSLKIAQEIVKSVSVGIKTAIIDGLKHLISNYLDKNYGTIDDDVLHSIIVDIDTLKK